jgi:tripartite-type tricarboxylate transporter receptor subunit TctC
VINRYLYKNPGYDQTKFVPVAVVAKMDYVLVTRKDFPARTVADLINLSKERAGGVTHASPGIGSTGYLASLEFEQQANIKLN